MENLFRDIAGYVMSCDEFKQLCRGTSDEDFNYLRFDTTKKSNQDKYCICNEAKDIN